MLFYIVFLFHENVISIYVNNHKIVFPVGPWQVCSLWIVCNVPSIFDCSILSSVLGTMGVPIDNDHWVVARFDSNVQHAHCALRFVPVGKCICHPRPLWCEVFWGWNVGRSTFSPDRFVQQVVQSAVHWVAWTINFNLVVLNKITVVVVCCW